MKKKKIMLVLIVIFVLVSLVAVTFATDYNSIFKSFMPKIIRIDEEAYGETEFNSSNLKLVPILDSDVSENNDSVMYIDFRVGGSIFNNIDSIIYDIALVDLEVDCELISPYLKWKLIKNGEVVSNGSLDYKFDTITNGRLVLTDIQQDLKGYSKNKENYDYYEFYMWISDSYQKVSLLDYSNEVDQSNMMNKRIKGKIEVELYAHSKEKLVRKPSNELNVSECVVGSDSSE